MYACMYVWHLFRECFYGIVGSNCVEVERCWEPIGILGPAGSLRGAGGPAGAAPSTTRITHSLTMLTSLVDP